MNKGNLAAFAAYLLWGFFPIYWKTVQACAGIRVAGTSCDMVVSTFVIGVDPAG